jgi:putative addiction module component (TIGR02574 family)
VEHNLTTSEIKKLSVAERILIVEEIWDSIAAEQESVQLTEAQKTELDRRITSCDSSPDEGQSWEEIKRRLSFQRP